MLLGNVFSRPKSYALLFTAFIFIITLSRLPLATKGHMHFSDELRYRYAFATMDGVREGNLKHGLSNLFRAYNRPVFIILSMIPASLQRFFDKEAGRGNVESDDLGAYAVPSIMNVLFSVGVIMVFHQILYLLTGDRFIAFSGMFVFSMLNTTYMEVRHMVPYYLAEFFFFFIVYRILKRNAQREYRTAEIVCYGIATSLVFNVYPGYFNLAVLIGGLIFFTAGNKLRTALVFASSFMIFPVLFELVSRYAELPYLFDGNKLDAVYKALPTGQARLSSAVSIVRYILGLEGVVGGILLALSALFVFYLLPKRTMDRRVKLIYIIIAGVYIFKVIMIYLAGKFTLRVKFCYPYIFLTTIAAFLFLHSVRRYQRIFVVGLVALSFVSFLFYYREYLAAVYPRDVRQRVREEYPGKKIIHTAEFYPKNMQRAVLRLAKKDKYDILGVNLRTVTRAAEYNPINIDQRFEVMSFPRVEAVYSPYSAAALNFSMDRERLRMRVYKLR